MCSEEGEHALALVDAGGLPALTLRALAARVGVVASGLYTYFPNRQAIVTALVDRLLGAADPALLTDSSVPWRERITAYSLELRTILLGHPGAVPAILGGPFAGPVALTVGEALLDCLAEAGLSDAEAARASYAIMVFVLGSISLEAAEIDPAAPVTAESERVAERKVALEALDFSAYPRTKAAADVIASYVSTEQFRWGLTRLLVSVAP